MTLLSRLFLLVAAALLPAIAIQTYNEFELRRSRQIEVQDHALGLAKVAAAEQQQIVQGIRQVMIALSKVPAIQAKDAQACDAYLSAIKERYPAFLTFLIVDTNGRSFCDTNSDHKPVNVAGRAYFANALKTGTFTVGKFSIGRSTSRNVIQFALPFYDDAQRMGGVIVAALSLDWLADHLAQGGVPHGTTLAITDRRGTVLARYPDNDRFAGSTIPAKPLITDHPATVDMVDLDGVERIVGYSALEAGSAGLLVSVGIDKAQAFAEIQRRTARGILLIILGTSMVLILTSLGARRFIHRPLGELLDAANEWQFGNYSCRVNIDERHPEIGWVGTAFNDMAEALWDRERELRDAKEKAEQAAARITTAFESATDNILIVDREWRITYINARAKAQIPDGRDLIGAELTAAFPAGSTRFQEAMSNQHPVSFEIFCAEHNAWYEVNAFPSSEGLAVYFRDVTEHKRALDAARLMQEQLHQSQKMEAVGQLTGGVAHDFNNLLTVVAGNLERIEDHAGDNERVRHLAAAARQAADRGAKLTAQLLTFSRRQPLEPKVLYADRLIREFEPLLRRAVGERCLIKLISEERLWPCHVDPAQLETAVLNLSLNGRDSMPAGGVLEIMARNVILEDGALAGLVPGPYVSLSVKDTGCGMSPETRDRVFEPFFTTKDVGKGTGLGLSMVYGFVRQSGGHVTVESSLGVGTTVTIYLPKAAQTPDDDVKAVQKEAVPIGSGRILVVEDDEQVLEITSAMLIELGYQVLRARNGASAIRMLESATEVDLLLSDVVMPHGMSGVELAREAKRLRDGIKVLLTSGYATDVLARHQARGEFPFISKPFYRAELAGCIWSVMREPRELASLDVSNALRDAQPWRKPEIEPPLSDVLADPLVQALMRRDGVSRTELESIIARAQRRLRRCNRPELAA
jgi:signal transduction histidine kinase/CheY-like chemotaxis protein/HAMP domain-containing protein